MSRCRAFAKRKVVPMPSNLPPRVAFLVMPRVFVNYTLQKKMILNLQIQSRTDQLVWLKLSSMEHPGLLTHIIRAYYGYSFNRNPVFYIAGVNNRTIKRIRIGQNYVCLEQRSPRAIASLPSLDRSYHDSTYL